MRRGTGGGAPPKVVFAAALVVLLIGGVRVASVAVPTTPPVTPPAAQAAVRAGAHDGALDLAAASLNAAGVTAAATVGWEGRAAAGIEVAFPPRPEPILVGEDLGAVDPSSWLAGSGRRDTLPQLDDRRFVTPPSPWLPDPSTPEFTWSIQEVPDRVLRRSTWHEGCPVTADELRWVRVSHVGFDGRAHGGELLVHRDAADGMVDVFRRLYEARYPIEKMRIAGGREPWPRAWWPGDDNTTTSFVCRSAVSGGHWSQHAYGLAVDINPFHNPYVKGDVLIPSHATAYLHRDDRPGIIHGGDAVDRAFVEELGWFWGGRWSSSIDYMHFSWNDW